MISDKEFIAKLDILRTKVKDEVLYRWFCSPRKLAGRSYVGLNLLRFESLSCRDGILRFSSAAGYLSDCRVGTVPKILFRDTDMFTCTGGNRIGYNVPMEQLRDAESFEPAVGCANCRVEVTANGWTSSKVKALGYATYYDVHHIVQPLWYRCVVKPNMLKLATTSEALKLLGWKPGTGMADFQEHFRENLTDYGQFTNEGYIIPYEVVTRGGKTVCSTKGFLTSPPVFCMKGPEFRAAVRKLGWVLSTGKEDVDDIGENCDLGELVRAVGK